MNFERFSERYYCKKKNYVKVKVRDEAFKYYFCFMQERMDIFWKRYNNVLPLTEDPILAQHKFTNVYRAQDRVSQYLIKNVIYGQSNEHFNEEDILLRILVFKIFNNIDTWNYIEEKAGPIRVFDFNVHCISSLLAERIQHTPVFSAAYMMNGSHKTYNLFTSKHEKWLQMVKHEMLREKRLQKIINAQSLHEIYDILHECTFIGSFLAYQYAIDFNYSAIINFSENSFVKAGIGAIRGIKKCFPEANKNTFDDCIRYTQHNLNIYREKYGFTEFKNLFGREPTLIDLQNCFCETDKYLRVKLPELQVDNTRIKQKFVKPKEAIHFFFPPKWKINRFIK